MGGFFALPTFYAIIDTSRDAHQLEPSFLFVFFVLVLNILLLAVAYYGIFYAVRWIIRKQRGPSRQKQ